MGLKKNVDIDRMKSYIDFMWKYHLHKHFSDEEIFLFPILNNDDRLITRAIEDHINITSLFKDDRCSNQTLASIAHKLEEHIRYEERILFNTIQDHLSDQQIKALLSHDRDIACGLWEDKFWK
jgi:hemerythrin-like domain-containing protein